MAPRKRRRRGTRPVGLSETGSVAHIFLDKGYSNMKPILLLFGVLCSGLAFGQTAREYYKEVHDANGLNPLLMFVCFPQQDTGLFETMALTRTFPKTAEEKHLKPLTEKDKKMFLKADSLFVQAFYKGVAREPLLFDKADKNSDVAWALNFTGLEGHPNVKSRITYRINWQTLRYETEVKIGTAAETRSGKCEVIE